MKIKITMIFLLELCCQGILHARTVDDIMRQKIVARPTYRLSTGFLNAVVLNMSFGESSVISDIDKKRIQNGNVVAVDLVYTDFPKGQDLTKLNTQRILHVMAIRKDLVSNELIQWRIIKQTSCTNEAEARVLFHGIVIHYQPVQDKELLRIDSAAIASLPIIGAEISKKITRDNPFGIKLKDSTVLQVLNRNKQWKNFSIVADLTGSMSPYSTQLLVWFQLKLKDNRVKQTVFFNDGDLKQDKDKKLGATGGIYFAKSTKYEDVLEAAKRTTSGGSGSDCPENNIEATLAALKADSTVAEIIMIADNFAPIKDFALASAIYKPVRIIVCGSEFGPINPHYLNLARMTGGSVHTMKDDLTKLSTMNEGEKIKINGTTYEIVGGKFVPTVMI